MMPQICRKVLALFSTIIITQGYSTSISLTKAAPLCVTNVIAATAATRPQMRGLAIVAKLGKSKTFDDQELALARALGASIVVWTPGEWADNEKHPQQYRLDPEVWRVSTQIAASQMKMILLLFRKNPLYPNPLDAQAFARYCAWMATTFRSMPVAAYQIWNEPSNFDVREYYGGAWNGRGGAPWVTEFAGMMREAAHAIHSVDPAATILASLEGPPLIDAMEATPQDFVNINGVSLHPYPGKLPAEQVPWGGAAIYLRDGVSVADPDGSLVSNLRIQTSIEPERYLNRQLQEWITEYGFPTCDPSVHPEHFSCVSEETQAAYHVRGLLLGVASGAKAWAPYDLSDDGNDVRDPEQNFGLTKSPGDHFRPKPAFFAIQRLAQLLGNGWTFSQRSEVTLHVSGHDMRAASSPSMISGPQLLCFDTPHARIAFIWDAGPMSDLSQSASVRFNNSSPVIDVKITNLVTGDIEERPIETLRDSKQIDRLQVSSRPIAVEIPN